jgi:hypothetical protein
MLCRACWTTAVRTDLNILKACYCPRADDEGIPFAHLRSLQTLKVLQSKERNLRSITADIVQVT